MTPGEQELLRQLRAEAAREATVKALGGTVEGLMSLGSGIAAQVPAGLHGAASFAKHLLTGQGIDESARRASKNVRRTQEALTYQPQSDLGQRGMQNVGAVIEPIAEKAKETFVDPVGMRSPALGAAMLAGVELVGPKGKPKAPKLRTDPGSPQALVPGVEPLTKQQMLEQALRERTRAEGAASFETGGLRYEHDPATSAYNVRGTTGETSRGETANVPSPMRGGGGQHVNLPEGLEDLFHRGGHDIGQRMLAKDEAVRAAREEVGRHAMPAAREEVAGTNRQIQRLREAREATLDPDEAVALEREIYHTLRGKPIVVETENVEGATRRGGAWRTMPEEGRAPTEIRHPSRWDYENPSGDSGSAELPEYSHLTRLDALREQQAHLVQALREQREIGDTMRAPEPVVPEWVRQLEREHPGREGGTLMTARPEGRQWWEEQYGIGPDAMKRESVETFIKGLRDQPEAFQYGTMPKGAHDLESIADVFAERAAARGEKHGKITVTRTGARSDYDDDEPYKIKRKVEHGHGETMYDVHGEPKFERYETGEKMKKEGSGRIKTTSEDVELFGPPRPEEFETGPFPLRYPPALWGEKKTPVRARGGEIRVDESGELVYKKSEGGEPKRDERGRIVKEEVENPDYRGPSEEQEKIRMRTDAGDILDIHYHDDDLPSMHATEASKARGGQMLYQAALAAHSLPGASQVGAFGLLPSNYTRMLANALSNYARTGKNPRHLGGTESGRATRASAYKGGFAEGPEIWRAEAEAAKVRVENQGGDATRVRFDPEAGFQIDGKPATGADIEKRLAELSPNFKSEHSKVGTKTLMRTAVFDWLRQASPEQAASIAKDWGKKYGALFAGAGISFTDVQEVLQNLEEQNGGNT